MATIPAHSAVRIGDSALRSETVGRYLPLVRAVARRFAGRGEELDDLVQVGTIGLIAAVDRFRPERGRDFAAYAIPTIAGEIRRHLRDRAPLVRLPRRLVELRSGVLAARRDLEAQLGRAATSAEVALALGVAPDDVVVLEDGAGVRVPLVDELEADDPFGPADERLDARALLATLDVRRRLILHLRFFEGLSQAEIAARLGISQIHVSRLIRSALEELADRLAGGA